MAPKWWMTTLVALVALTGAARAQEVGQDPSVAGMSADDIREDVAARLEQMETAMSGVSELRAVTQEEDRDLTRVRCIDNKLAAIQGFLRLSDDSRDRLETALARDDADGVQHQYTLIAISTQRVENLQREASQCAGDILTFAGDTERQSTVDPDIPDEADITDADRAAVDLVRIVTEDPLPEATPFQ